MWQGFVIESKRYMNHPDYWPERNNSQYKVGGWTTRDKRIAALKFWLAFPQAWIRFQWLILWDWLENLMASIGN